MVLRRFRHDPLAGVDETTPHRFALSVSDPPELIRATAALSDTQDEWTVQQVDGRLVVESTFSPRNAAILRPLNTLRRAGVKVNDIEFLDVVEVTDRGALARIVSAWQRDANRGPARRRVESVGGAATLDALDRIVVAARNDDAHSAARFAFGCATFNTPGSERRSIALAVGNPKHASQMVGWALDRSRVAELTGSPTSFDVDNLLEVIRAGGYTAERALGLIRLLPAPLEPELRIELVRLAEGGGELAADAALCLGHAEPDDELRELLDRLITKAPTNVRASALTAASHLWGPALRPVWHAWLGGRSAPLSEAAEEMLGAHGDADDIEVAAAQLAKLIRRRPGQVSWHEPREAPVIELLLRHRGELAAEAAFDDLFARWDRLDPDVHDWLRRTHPDVKPDTGGTHSSADGRDAVSAEPADSDVGFVDDAGVWPLPAIEPFEDGVTLRFDDTDMYDTKDRFEALCAAHPAVEIVDEDGREVLHLDVHDPDPVAIVVQLWADAGGDPVA